MEKPVYKGFYNIVQNKESKETTISIYGVIGGFDFDKWEWINTADKFVEDFAKVESESDLIHVKINSPGGNIHDGLPIYNALRNSKKIVYTYIDGIAYSMAALIALSGDKVFAYSNSIFMVHNASTIAFGNAKDLRTEAGVIDKYDKSLASIIAEKLNISDEKAIEDYLDYNDNYYTGKEAKQEGFVDKIIKSEKASTPENLKNMSPVDILKHYSAMNFSKLNNHKLNKTTMSKERTNVQTVLGLEGPLASNDNGVYLNDEQLDAIEAHLADQRTKIATLNDQKTTAESERDTAKTGLTDLNTSINSLAVKANAETVEGDVVATLTNIENRVNELNQLDATRPSTVKIDSKPTGEGAPKGYNPESAHNKIANSINN